MSPVVSSWVRWVGSLGGVGFSPWIPGTAGSLLALAPVLLAPALASPRWLLPGCAVATVLCWALARRLPPKSQGGDPGWFVLDEAAGMWLTLLIAGSASWQALTASFLLFRVFDMTKPPPLSRLERTAGPWGIVLDDLGAAGYAGLAVLGLRAAFGF